MMCKGMREGAHLLVIMHNLCIWNVRGINIPKKQKDVARVLHMNKVALCGLVETKIKQGTMVTYFSHYSKIGVYAPILLATKGAGFAWQLDTYEVNPLLVTDQVNHCRVKHIPTATTWECSVMYGFNSITERVSLWTTLNDISDKIQFPWMVGGDFNNVLHFDERVGSPVTALETRDFKNCIGHCGLLDLKYKGCFEQ